MKVGTQNRYDKTWTPHFDPDLLADVDELCITVFGQSAYECYRNATHFQQTHEQFGISKLPELKAKQLSLEIRNKYRAALAEEDDDTLEAPFGLQEASAPQVLPQGHGKPLFL